MAAVRRARAPDPTKVSQSLLLPTPMQIQFKKTIINSQLNSKRQKGAPLSAPNKRLHESGHIPPA